MNRINSEQKKLLKIEFDFSGDFDDYITKYLSSIQDVNDDKYGVLTNKNSNILYYHFNSYLHSENTSGQLIRHSIKSDDTFALNTLQSKNWPYFIDRIIQFSQSQLDLNSFCISGREEADIVLNTKKKKKLTSLKTFTKISMFQLDIIYMITCIIYHY